ncbi:cysteine desulfurase [Pseudoalteromonas xiamenensis]|uniref:aminotransferase class V-fold PLP-dependent enzyme n=1 Tax=Pseudoalteromonas xiamenensis TaxID=882626 RepID=UPI0027E3EAC2|nr:cysteine desulfurase [Pseudoalteromonas xiamenensis]WMN59914.1 cysteine desulfurase [Pseudoalteromonas xiamenensis]
MFDIQAIRSEFPILESQVHGNPLVYFDNGATTQKPKMVIEAERQFYLQHNANVHRGAHYLSACATRQYEETRSKLAVYLEVEAKEIVWTKGATESLNLIAHGLQNHIEKNEIILLSELEHHANIVPWQQLANKTGAIVKAIPVDSQGIISVDVAVEYIQRYKPRIFAIAHASNGLGNIQPVAQLLAEAKKHNAICIVDGAQAFAHLAPKPLELGCDFYVGSAHKAFGPTGVGFLYGRYDLLNKLLPYQTGGEMIDTVTIEHTTFNDAPSKFEAGTPNIAGVVAFGAALKFMQAIDRRASQEHEHTLRTALVEELRRIPNIVLFGDHEHNIGTVSFVVNGVHPLDIATLLDHQGIAVRTGHHCNQPLMHKLQISGTIRVSFSMYNTLDEIALFITALNESLDLLKD